MSRDDARLREISGSDIRNAILHHIPEVPNV
jgi:hypothetical protein